MDLPLCSMMEHPSPPANLRPTLMAGESSGFLLMGSFIRELNFGIWVNQSYAASASGNWHSNAYAGGFRVEVFPIGWLVPALRDIGVIGQFGIGGGNLVANVGNSPGADGVQSYVGTGAFWEWMFAHPGRTRWVAVGVGAVAGLGDVAAWCTASRPWITAVLAISVAVIVSVAGWGWEAAYRRDLQESA